MVYITGDTHGELARFEEKRLKKLNEDDCLIICGDFGFIWDGSQQEAELLKHIGEKRFKTLFIEGTHENFDLLGQYPEVELFGAKANQIYNNLYHLKRGEIYTIDGELYFTFGGGDSPDREMRIAAGSWWKQEIPTVEEMERAVVKLNDYDRHVDYIITHEPSGNVRSLIDRRAVISSTGAFFDELSSNVKYKNWFFGSVHFDRKVSSKNRAVFTDIVPVHSEKSKRRIFGKKSKARG